MEADAPVEIEGLPSVFFTIVSETLISAILSDIPQDERVLTAVRELVADHAEDEGRHHAFFSSFFGCVWPQLTRVQRRLLGPLLPELVLAFLEPDFAALATIVGRSGLDEDGVRRVLEESHPPDAVRADIRRNSRATLRLFAEHGVFDEAATREAFAEAQLLAPSSEEVPA
jgi:hypothetical protein